MALQRGDPSLRPLTRKSHLRRDTTYGFHHLNDYNFNVSANTKVYGTYDFTRYEKFPLKMLRHTITPTIGFRYTPNFGSPTYGLLGTLPDLRRRQDRLLLPLFGQRLQRAEPQQPCRLTHLQRRPDARSQGGEQAGYLRHEEGEDYRQLLLQRLLQLSWPTP